MVNFSEILMFFSGNGFTDQEAFQVSVQIAKLADMDKIWIEGVASQLVRNGEFEKLDPQNNWQEEVSDFLSDGLSPRERQCYFLYEIQKMKPVDIGKKLGISRSAFWKYMDNIKYKSIADESFEVTEEMLKLLSKRNRECFLLHEYHSLDFVRIGRTLDIDPAAAKRYFRKAKMQLHDLVMGSAG